MRSINRSLEIDLILPIKKPKLNSKGMQVRETYVIHGSRYVIL